MRVYITKFALTQGIIEKEVEISSISDKMVVDRNSKWNDTYHLPFWYIDKNDAINHANLLKDRKIKSLKNELKKFVLCCVFSIDFNIIIC